MSDDIANPFEDEELEGTEVAEAEDNEAEEEPDDIEIAFSDAMEEGKTEDEIMLAMIEAGATFKNVKSRYNALMVDTGMLDSRAEKQKIVSDTLEGMELAEEDGFTAAVEALVENLKGVNAKSAAASIRQYAKKNELEVYKKPKGTGTGRAGITSLFYDWIIANLPVTDDQVNDWIATNGTENTKRNARAHVARAHLANRAYNKASGKVEEAA